MSYSDGSNGGYGKIIGLIALAFLGVFIALTFIGFNSSQTASNQVEAKIGDLDAQYQRRVDLIPNLVSTVQAAAAHEESVLTSVTRLRSAASEVPRLGPNATDAERGRYEAAQQSVSQQARNFLVTVEAYPALRANEGFLRLQSELAGTENRITVARRDVNIAIRDYNNEVDTFPSVIGARMRGLTHRASYTAVTPNADQGVRVNFNNGAAAQH
ncbi:LemA family protein [Patescibacteria group bacterium]|nr:LemA family protein [Patescibacteria group bacterium]